MEAVTRGAEDGLIGPWQVLAQLPIYIAWTVPPSGVPRRMEMRRWQRQYGMN